MTYEAYAGKLKKLSVKRYYLLLTIATEGPYVEREVHDDICGSGITDIATLDYVTALAEIDEQISDLIAAATKEEWFKKHSSVIEESHASIIDFERLCDEYSYSAFPF